jgi:hypothetical protein
MNNQNFTAAFSVDQSPEEVFDAINNARGWWSEEIDGRTDKLGADIGDKQLRVQSGCRECPIRWRCAWLYSGKKHIPFRLAGRYLESNRAGSSS